MSEQNQQKTPRSGIKSSILKRPQSDQTKSKTKGNLHLKEENPSKIKEIQSSKTQKLEISQKMEEQQTYDQGVEKSAKSKMSKSSANRRKIELIQQQRQQELMRSGINMEKTKMLLESGKNIQTIEQGHNNLISTNQKQFSCIKHSQQVSQPGIEQKKISTESKKTKLALSGKQSKTSVKKQAGHLQIPKQLDMIIDIKIEAKKQATEQSKHQQSENQAPQQRQMKFEGINVELNKKQKSELKNKQRSISAKKIQKSQVKKIDKSDKKPEKMDTKNQSATSNIKNPKSQIKNPKSSLKNAKSSKKLVEEDEDNGIKSKKKAKIDTTEAA